MIRKTETIRFWRRTLPHWEVVNGVYFVTIHLQGAIPVAGHDRIRHIADSITQSNYEGRHRHVFLEMEKYLDCAPHVCHLTHPGVADIVTEALQYRHAKGDWQLIEYVIMPNHIHLFYRTGKPMQELLDGFKSRTGRQASQILGLSGRFWQRDWFDHWSRSPAQDEKIVRYIQQNPVKAGLVQEFTDWPHGSWESSCREPDVV
jgi:REP element-mobilizing transposase RayT